MGFPAAVETEEEVRRNCTVENIQRGIERLAGVTVVSAEINDRGSFDSPYGRIDDLPPFCDIRVHVRGKRRTTTVTVWAPLAWNGRFLGTAGGGNRTDTEWMLDPSGIGVETYDMGATLPAAVRRGFATASTDGGNADARDFAWGLNISSGELDEELITNWHHLATKQMAEVGKAVTAAVYGVSPSYSYLVGTSGGGRQTVVTAQMYPEAFDGYWASCPAINWSHFSLIGLWPAVVMNEHGTVLRPGKLEAFRLYALEYLEGAPAIEDGFLSSTAFPRVDALGAVGRATSDGVLTRRDAQVMNAIWRGPCRRDGTPLWFGLPVGAESWGDDLWGLGLVSTQDHEGRPTPLPLSYATDWAGSWILRDAEWDWKTLTVDGFIELFDRSVEEFADYDSATVDFAALDEAGGRLLLTHSNADGLIPPQGSVEFYDRIVQRHGGRDVADRFVRLFIAPGGGHSSTADGHGLGISLDAGLIALIDWVESGSAPDVLIARHRNRFSGEVEMQRPVFPYPVEAQYAGGDRRLPTSFVAPADS